MFFFRLFFLLAPKGRTPTGGDVWVLLIRDAKPTDTDVYVCEVNSDPVLRSFHPLRGNLSLLRKLFEHGIFLIVGNNVM